MLLNPIEVDYHYALSLSPTAVLCQTCSVIGATCLAGTDDTVGTLQLLCLVFANKCAILAKRTGYTRPILLFHYLQFPLNVYEKFIRCFPIPIAQINLLYSANTMTIR